MSLLQNIRSSFEGSNVAVISYSPEREQIGYSPASMGGGGARVHITEGMSLSSWEHEHDHFKFDEALGFPGIAYYLRNRGVWADMERRAYALEIEKARLNGYNELVKKLESNLAEELRKLGIE